MLPGIIALAVFAEGLLSLIGQADLRAVALILVGILALAGLAWVGKRLMGHRQ
jgi:phospholipase D1/2